MAAEKKNPQKKKNLLFDDLEKIKIILDANPLLKKRVLSKINELKNKEDSKKEEQARSKKKKEKKK